MEGTLLASGLGFPEGPVVMPDGSIVLCDGNTGQLLRWASGEMRVYAETGGSPWGAILGTDGAIYLTQGGNVPGAEDQSFVPGIQRVNADGSIEMLTTSVAGITLAGPNDLAFGPDGRLWFTDSGTEGDDRYDPRSPGQLFAIDATGDGEQILERPQVYPNGIAFDRDGVLYWTESMVQRVCRLVDGDARDLLSAARDARPRRLRLRRRRPALRLHDDLRGPDGPLARGRDPRGDLDRQQRDQLHLRRLDPVRHRHQGRLHPRRRHRRHVLERRDRRDRAAAADPGQALAGPSTAHARAGRDRLLAGGRGRERAERVGRRAGNPRAVAAGARRRGSGRARLARVGPALLEHGRAVCPPARAGTPARSGATARRRSPSTSSE